MSYEGHCFCGAVEVAVDGEPMAMGYCHCADCRAWSAAPVTAYTIWPTDAVSVTKGEDSLIEFCRSGTNHRVSCRECGGSVMSKVPAADFIDVYAPLLTGLEFKPTAHLNYGASVLRIRDGLPKLKDFPAEMGGSGETLPE